MRFLLCRLLLAGAVSGQFPSELRTFKEIEAYLASAPILAAEKDIETGRTLPWRVTLKQGQIQARALFKHVDRRTLQSSRHSYRYELAAYALSRLLDLDIVPPAIERTIEGRTGSLQWYAENCLTERDRRRLKQDPPDLAVFLRRLEIVQVFEALAAENCGDQDDTLIHQDSWKICRVDFSGGFRPTPSIASACVIRHCSRTLFHRLEGLERAVIANQLKRLLDPEEIDALFRRIRQVVETLKTEIREKGESAVLFDEK